ncbi:DUF975 family protein [Mobilitalea sibirica]|nr:DUF975 family protein [Mobilitalea sibirica]
MLYAADFRKIARDALRGKWALAVGTGFVAMVLGGVSRGGSSNGRGDNSNSFVFQELSSSFWVFITVIISFILLWALITFFIGGAVELGYCRFNKNLIQGTNPQLKDLFSRFDIFFKALGLRIVIAIFTFLWGLLLIIPGIIAALSYSMAFYIMEENPSMGILDAIGESKEMMRGNKFRLFCLGLSFIGWLILCVFTFGIGMLWLVPYMNASFAAFYLEVSKSDETLA